jgi:integrase
MISIAIAVIEPARHSEHNPLRNAMQSLVLDGLSSPHTRRAYEQALDEFLIWLCAAPARPFAKASVQRYRTELQAKGLAPSSVNVRISAIRRLALEASDNGLLAPEIAAGIGRVKGAKHSGVRLGRWLTLEQAEELLRAPDHSTVKGARDSAILAVLLGSGVRRSEAASLAFEHLQQREERWVIADLVGKHGRIRTVPISDWVYAAIRRWADAVGLTSGRVFRALDKRGRVRSLRLSAQSVFNVLKLHAAKTGVLVTPHDARRTWAHLAYKGHAPLEQIQLSLGHASIVTTELYLGIRQDLRDAPCDHLGITP